MLLYGCCGGGGDGVGAEIVCWCTGAVVVVEMV